MTETFGKKTIVVDRKGVKKLVTGELTLDWDELVWRLARKARTNKSKVSKMDIGIKFRVVSEEDL